MKISSTISAACLLALATAHKFHGYGNADRYAKDSGYGVGGYTKEDGYGKDGDVKVNQVPNFSYDELYALQQSFWKKFQYPNNIKEANSINSTVFSEDVLGRVSDTRNFVGRELNTEYIFGLFTPSDSVSIIGRPGSFEITQFLGQRNIAAASTRVNFTFPSFNNLTLPVQIDTWLTWNSKREISQYDVTFRWFAYLIETLISSAGPSDPAKAKAAVVNQVATSICKTHDTYCHDGNKQYDSNDECYKFLTKEIRVGQTFELGMNTLLCRNVHEIMIKYRPDVHCSHIGKTGGGMCDDSISYQTKVTEKYFVNAPWIPKMPRY